MPEAELEPESDDSDFEFDGVRTKKGKAKTYLIGTLEQVLPEV